MTIHVTIDLEEFEVRYPNAKSKQALMVCYGDAVFWVTGKETYKLTELRLDNGIWSREPLILRWDDLTDEFLYRLFQLIEDRLLADESIVEQLVIAYRDVA